MLSIDLITSIGIILEDARPILLASKTLYMHHLLRDDRTYWQAKNKIASHIPKIPGYYTLSKFVKYGNLRMVKHLVESGIAKCGINSILMAAEYGHLEVIKYLATNYENVNEYDSYALLVASSHGHINIVKYLISVGADVTARDNRAVCQASEYGYLEVVEYLVSMGADVTANDNYAIQLANKYGQYDVVDYLVSIGCTL